MNAMFTPAEIGRLLDIVAAMLDERGIHATIIVAGGATMGYIYDARPSTRDVDALVQPKDAVLAIAAEVAETEDLPADWLNDKFAMFWPQHGEPDFSHVVQHGAVTISYAGPRVPARRQGDRRKVGSRDGTRWARSRRAAHVGSPRRLRP